MAGRRWLVAGLIGVATLTAAGPGVAATQTTVDCAAGASLQGAIDTAKAGTILEISGTCHGPFTIGKNLVLKGISAAVLDGQGLGTTLTVTKGKVRITRVTITGGLAPEGGGGIVNAGTLTLIRDAIDNNRIDEGSGAGILNSGTMVLQRSTVNSNRTFDIGGGGIRNDGTMTIDHSTVNGNPGGIYNSAQLLMSYTTVSRNGSCPEPGGLWNGGTATVRFSTFALNSSCNSSGGGISNGGSITIVGSTIVDNTADEGGGGLLNGGTATIAATIIAGNEDTSGDSSDCVGTIVSQGYNLIGFDVDMATGSACVVTGGPNDQIGSSSPIDAMLKPLGNYGGPTQTILPRPDSPAVNAVPTGTTTTVGTALCPASGTTDQRGIQRPQSAACDIGSVERKPKE